MHSRSVLLVAFAASTALAPECGAQVSKAMSPASKIQSLADEVSPEKRKAALQATATALREQANAILGCMSECGVALAEADGPYEDEREKLREVVELFLRDVTNVENEGRLLYEDVSSDKCADVKLAIKEMTANWEGFKKQIEETRKFLSQGLNTAGTLRNDLGKAGELMEKQEQEAKKEEDAAVERKKALFSKWVELTQKSNELDAKQKEAYERWYDFVKNGGDPYSDKGLELIVKWDEILDAVKEIKIDVFEAFVELDEASKELFELYKERAAADEDLRQFIEDMTENDANRSWSQFDAWLKLFEKDVGA